MPEIDEKIVTGKLKKEFSELEEDVANDPVSGWIAYADRLDEVFGFPNWKSDFDSTTNKEIRCTITLLHHKGTYRVGVGSDKNKAFIHACEQFGIGQYIHVKKYGKP